MSKPDKNTYDVIIIGAGISGLVCGCYLAKAGLKVLIAEQHGRPGGYCASFKRKGFTFDAAAHCFGAYREEGVTHAVFRELGIDRKIRIIKSNPALITTTPDHSVTYWTDLGQTIDGFQKSFPGESGAVSSFFDFLLNPDPQAYFRIRNWTFKDLLDQYFVNEKLKAVLAAPLLGLGGLPPSLMSAFIGVKLFSEFLLDGGYHPEGGMQALPDALSERFKELGGTLLLSCRAKKIELVEGRITSVVLEKHGRIPSLLVVSGCDARQTYLDLIGRSELESGFYDRLTTMLPSISNYILYVGLDKYFDTLPRPGTTFCSFLHYDLDKAYRSIPDGNIDQYGGYMFYVSDEQPTILAIIPAPFRTPDYWMNKKERFGDSFIERLEKHSIPRLSHHIVSRDAATPATLHRYTLNYQGASYGWAGTPSQFAVPDFKKTSFIQGLYLTGHWTTHGIGISGVIYVGQDISKLILSRRKCSKI